MSKEWKFDELDILGVDYAKILDWLSEAAGEAVKSMGPFAERVASWADQIKQWELAFEQSKPHAPYVTSGRRMGSSIHQMFIDEWSLAVPLVFTPGAVTDEQVKLFVERFIERGQFTGRQSRIFQLMYGRNDGR